MLSCNAMNYFFKAGRTVKVNMQIMAGVPVLDTNRCVKTLKKMKQLAPVLNMCGIFDLSVTKMSI